ISSCTTVLSAAATSSAPRASSSSCLSSIPSSDRVSAKTSFPALSSALSLFVSSTSSVSSASFSTFFPSSISNPARLHLLLRQHQPLQPPLRLSFLQQLQYRERSRCQHFHQHLFLLLLQVQSVQPPHHLSCLHQLLLLWRVQPPLPRSFFPHLQLL
ncbi:hypothetical protein ACHAXM_009574, partial [Skeletonema potamos]